MANALSQIMSRKRDDVAVRKRTRSSRDLEELAARQSPPRGFRDQLNKPGLRLIAEIKRASPSKGLIRADFDPTDHALAYESGGASCLSVLTDGPGFQGEDDHLIAARSACALPVLRKDFCCDPYQVLESRALGADAILIILAAIDDACSSELMSAAEALDLDVLVEVHDREELDRAERLGAPLIGVNNRDLRTFETRLETFEALAPHAPQSALLVAESGIVTHQDALRMQRAGAGALLVGESLMRQDNLTTATRVLLGRSMDATGTLDADSEQA